MTRSDQTYKGLWPLFDKLPEGWGFDKTVGSPLARYRFVTNGKSVINGQQRALLKVGVPIAATLVSAETHAVVPLAAPELPKEPHEPFPAKTVNDLARAKFKSKLLSEILFDLMVCEIEGWSKLDYIAELKSLIDSLRPQLHSSVPICKTMELFA